MLFLFKIRVARHYISMLAFLTAFHVMLPNSTRAQQAAVINVVTSGQSLKEELSKLAQDNNYALEYQSDLFKAGRKSRVLNLKNVTLPQALRILLEKEEVDFVIQGKGIVLYQKSKQQTQAPRVISGRVLDGEGHQLPFASVQLKPASLVTTTDERGSFSFPPVEYGNYEIVVSYMGFEKQKISVALLEGVQLQPLRIELSPNTKALAGVTVTGMRRGEATALSVMKEATNMKYVLSQEQIERFPDLTVGESLQRVPGLTMAYSYGRPQAVIMRGLEAEDGSVTINGNRVPSTEPRYRTVDLNGILAATVDRIEVVKTLTPDMDADGTAGTINIVTKTPPGQSQFLDIRSSGGYNMMSSKGSFDGGLTYGARKDKWGFIVGGNYSKSGRGEDRIKKSYGSALGDEELYTLLKGIELEATDLKLRNFGVQAELNFYPRENELFYLRGSYNGYLDVQQQHNLNYSIKDYTTHDRAENITLEGNGWYRESARNTMMFSTGGKKFLGRLQMDYDVSYAGGFFKSKKDVRTVFEQKKLAGDIDLGNPEAPQIAFDKAGVMDPELFAYKYLRDRRDEAEDEDWNAKLNFKYPFRIFSKDQGYFQVGGRFRHKSTNRNRGEDEYAAVDKLTLTNFVSPFSRSDFFHDSYGLSLFPDALSLNNYRLQHPAAFEIDETGSIRNSTPDTYEGTETLKAAYMMATWNVGALEMVAGVRYERTGLKYTGNMLVLGPDDVYVDAINVHADKDFDGFLPSVNLRYALTKRTNLRAAATRSLSRPGYFDLVPWEEVREDNGNIKRGNPDLTQAFTNNYDLMAEHYFQSVGLLSAGFFYKDVKNKVYKEKVDQIGGEWDGYTIETPRNGKNATVYGLEFAWQQQFTFLPGALNGLGIYANYTRVWSEMRTPNVDEGRKVALPDARPSSGNIAISYQKYGFSGRIAANFYGTYVRSVGNTPAEDSMENGRTQLDFSASQKIYKKFSVFAGLNNLTNAPISTRYRDGRPDNDRNYGVWGNIGFRYSAF
ncbi:TonB-dependent receptor [Pedobacter sp. AW31-3R]|uniref:TonB-dependent receptor n=1 Tax=Pedobacter sp. AW31-3R TaxID=3445781 RepID=UPI003F9FF9EC